MIEEYAFGRITVDGSTYRSDLKIYPDGIKTDWWRKSGHKLRPDDLPELRSQKLDHLVIGCGSAGRLTVTRGARELFDDLGLSWSALPTGQAVEEYNKRLAAGERVGAALHLTC
ncbi:MAG: hypothetical protein GY762_03655 [Proteobacteria bacterium]|nr:hypothetical protein [Pseudomonadota bacterium]